MCRTVWVMTLVALCVGFAHSFSWDIVMNEYYDNRLQFVDINGTISHTDNVTSTSDDNFIIRQITYDPVHDRVLFADTVTIFSFDVTTKKTERLITVPHRVSSLAYDPATELLVWVENAMEIYSITLKPKLNKNKDNEKHLILTERSEDIFAMAVDSCEGFIYWSFLAEIKRIRFNGSENEVVINKQTPNLIKSFTIDPQTLKMYFTDMSGSIMSADLNGKNIRTIRESTRYDSIHDLTVTKDFIYWICSDCSNENNTYHYNLKQFPKNITRGIDVEPKQFGNDYRPIAAYWNINDIIPQEVQNCDNLKSLLPNNSISTEVSLLCVHGTKVDGESRCECTQGYSGERCEVSVCHNYCLYGDCSTSTEGQPKCRCNTGYTGERCELYACQGYCLYGDCTTSADGQPKCSCNVGYVGNRCEVNSCLGYCLNDGLCSLSEEGKPLCRCRGHYEGERCDVPLFQTKCFQAISLLKDMLNTDVTRLRRLVHQLMSKEVKPLKS